MQEIWVQFLDQKDLLEKQMETHPSIPAWKIPWTEGPGRLQSRGHKESDMTQRLDNTTIFIPCECVCFTSSASRHLPMDIQVVSVSCAKSLQSCLTFCDLTDCSPPDSSFHGILQARILEQIAVAFSSFLVLAIINSADMKSGCMYLFELEFLSFLNIHPGVGLLNHMVALLLVF